MTRRPASQRAGAGRPAAAQPSAAQPADVVAPAAQPADVVAPAAQPADVVAPAASAVPAQRLALDGELTIQTAVERRGTLLAALEAFAGPGAPEHEPIELDLSEVSELDTAGVQVLLVVQRELESLGRSLRIVGAHTAVAEVLAIAHLTDLLAGEPVAIREESSR